jgi:hypothetical protein
MTEPSRASSLATASDRAEERMALTELRVSEGTMVLGVFGFKGTFAKAVNHLGGRRLFGWFLRSALAAIEKTADADAPNNPPAPTS